MAVIYGFDSSHHNDDRQFEEMLQEKENKFCIMKATEGKTFKDPLFMSRVEKLSMSSDIVVGAYHYARPENNSPLEEFRNFSKNVDEARAILGENLLLALDFEGNALTWSTQANREQWIREWVNLVKMRYSYSPLFYIQTSEVGKYKVPVDLDCGLWLADYSTKESAHKGHWPFLAMRQYTNKPYDKNKFFGTIEQLNKYRGM